MLLKDKRKLKHQAVDGSAGRSRRSCSPTFIDPVKIRPTGTNPHSWCRATAASPADAIQPQFAQSGAPPNWQGVIFVVRSAEMVHVVRANTQSSGDAGGFAHAVVSPC